MGFDLTANEVRTVYVNDKPLSRRDYFAGLIFKAEMHKITEATEVGSNHIAELIRVITRSAAILADELIAELDRPKEPRNQDVPAP